MMIRGEVGKRPIIIDEKPKFFRVVIIPTVPIGGTTSIPADVGITAPQIPIKDTNSKEYPQEMSRTDLI